MINATVSICWITFQEQWSWEKKERNLFPGRVENVIRSTHLLNVNNNYLNATNAWKSVKC